MKIGVIWFLVCFNIMLSSESLWDFGSSGFYTGQRRVQEGDVFHIQLDGETSFSFSSTKASEKNLSLELHSQNSPLDFFPQGKNSDRLKIEGKNEFKPKSMSLAARVTKVASDGTFHLQGSSSVQLGGGIDTVELSAVADSRDLQGRNISWKALTDLKLAFVMTSESATPRLQPQDFTDQERVTPEKQKTLLREYYNRFLNSLLP